MLPMRALYHPTPEQFTLEGVFHALSDPLRLAVVLRLSEVQEATCGELDCGRPKSSMSHHFRILREAGLVSTRNAGSVLQNALRRAELDERFPGLLTAILAQKAARGAEPPVEAAP